MDATMGDKPRHDTGMSKPVLETRDLTIRFGGHVAVDSVSAAFHVGTLTAIVGPNGAGKTTYFNLISGQLAATSGNVLIDGVEVTKLGAARRAKLGIGRAFQLTNLFPNLTAHENVRLAVQARAGGGANIFSRWNSRRDWIKKADRFIEAANLADKHAMPAMALPHGDKRKLEVAIMMALEPHVFMFDEPTAGMSVDDVPVILDLIKKLKSEGDKTILLVEHKMDVVKSLADRIVVLNTGRLVADGEPAEVMGSAVVQEAYLGVAASRVGTRAEAPHG
jgi:branched-chain amino acid transport system ATP-binding protein